MKKISTDVKPITFFSLFRESDRGCVLLMGEIYSMLLEQILESAIVANRTGETMPPKFFKDISPNSNGPFSSFDKRITLAYSFKLITFEQYKCLHAVRELRNEVAHRVFNFTLDNEGVLKHLKQLEKYRAQIDMEKLMEFETFVPKVDDTNMKRFEFVVTGYQIYFELSQILGDQLERILVKREQLKHNENLKKPFHIPSGEFTREELEKANPHLDQFTVMAQFGDSLIKHIIVDAGNGKLKKAP
jgi:hypothetical protein